MSEHQIFVTVNGVSKTPQEWSDYLGVSVASFFMRLQDGRNVDDQLFGAKASATNIPKVEKVERNGRSLFVLTLKGKTQTLKEWCDEIGIGMTSLRYRLEKGYTEEQILQPRQATNSKELPIQQPKVKEKAVVEKKPVSKKVKERASASSKKVEKEKPKKKEAVSKKNSKKEQVQMVTLLNTALPIKEWADTIGVSVDVLNYRINEGWSEQEILHGKKYAVEEPIVTKNPDKFVLPETGRSSELDQEVCFEGEFKTLREWSVELGISQNVIRNRMNQGKMGRELLLPVKDVEARVGVRIRNRELSFRQWAEISGVPEDIIRTRYNNGLRGEQLIFLDPKYRKKQA